MNEFWSSKTITLEFLASQQLKFQFVDEPQTIHKFVQQCCFFQSEARTIRPKFTAQAANIAHTSPTTFPKKTINYMYL